MTDRARLATRLFGSGNVLIIHRFTLDLVGGDHLAALFLEQLLYWTERTSNRDGWIVKTYEQWESELGLSKYLVRRIAETLKPYGVETELHRSQFHKMQPVVHYRVNLDALEAAIAKTLSVAKVSLSESEEISLSESENASLSITETTTETIGREAPLPGSHFEPPAIRVMANDTALQMNGYQLVQSYATETGLPAETIWQTGKKVAAALAKANITPDDVTGFMTEMRTTQRDRYQGYRFAYLAEDLPRWKQNRADKPVAVELTPAQKAAADKALEAERRAWREAQGLA